MAELSKEYMISLADKYEVSSFYDEDPSQFLKWYSNDKIVDVECASFIAAMLAFGNRKQFIPKIKMILEIADKTSGSISAWLKSGASGFETGSKKFYRFYSYDDMHCLFFELASIIKENKTLGEYFENQWKSGVLGDVPLGEGVAEDRLRAGDRGRLSPQESLDCIISKNFPKSSIVPKGKNSANKRIHMFLRWMVRQNSCVDLGLWSWYPAKLLLIPLDVHVLQESKKLGLLDEGAGASKKTAAALTKKMEEYFPDDPARGDFALFGIGVDSSQK